MARVRRRQLVARAWTMHEFLAGLYGGGASPARAVRAQSGLRSREPDDQIRDEDNGHERMGSENGVRPHFFARLHVAPRAERLARENGVRPHFFARLHVALRAERLAELRSE